VRHLVSCGIVSIVLGAAAAAHAADPQLMAPIHKFIDSFNKGDTAGAAATHSATADLAIVDEVPPHLWSGPNAFQAWGADLAADMKKNGLTDASVTLGAAPTREESDGQNAYVVVPAAFSFKQNGKAMREKAQMTFVLKKDASGWLIHSWTWTGPRPTAAATGTAAPKPKP
jgi:ketosteroid isomerase-like protein